MAKDPDKLTTNQEAYCAARMRGLTQRAAYREAYPRSRAWKDSAVDTTAAALEASPKVFQRLEAMRAEAAANAIGTREEVISMAFMATRKAAEEVQAAITRRETRQSWQDAPNVLDRENLRTIDRLTAERDELKAEIAKYEHDCGLLFDEKHKLTAERDELREKLDQLGNTRIGRYGAACAPNAGVSRESPASAESGREDAAKQADVQAADPGRDGPWLADEWEIEGGKIVAIVKGGTRFVREQPSPTGGRQRIDALQSMIVRMVKANRRLHNEVRRDRAEGGPGATVPADAMMTWLDSIIDLDAIRDLGIELEVKSHEAEA